MTDVPSASEITGLAGLLAPGLVILGIRARFKDGKLPGLKDQVIGYGVASTAYYAAAYPLFMSSVMGYLSQFGFGSCANTSCCPA